jgi:GDP-L-fucose synthase|tara:strand:+ start:1217 stop:2173 length:957 start_codon:yes stop_codon:yes gene_type:complete
MLNKNPRIFLAGHNGLVGGAILKQLIDRGYTNIITVPKKKLDLRNQKKVFNFIKAKKPKFIIIAAASVGGIAANNVFKADFIYNNIAIQNNLIHSAFLNGVKNLIFLGSSCVYPRKCKQPIKEEYLLTGSLEKTNEPYAVAKIAGIKMCESYNYQYNTNYLCLMPCNAFGPNDNYDLLTSHFFPALIRKLSDAVNKKKKSIKLWGTGKAKRELIYVDNIADACIFFMNKKVKHTLINIGSEEESTIKQFVKKVRNKIGKNIQIKFDNNKVMDGTPRKILDCSLARSYGWKKKVSFDKGLELTLNDFFKRKGKFRKIKF